jgi:choline dehydrogenase
MKNYWEKIENCEYLPNSVAGHGFSGWLSIGVADLKIVAEDFKIAMWLIAAANFMGTGLLGSIISTTTQLLNVLGNDVNSGLPNRDSTEGLFQIPLTTHKGQRKWTQGISTQHSKLRQL